MVNLKWRNMHNYFFPIKTLKNNVLNITSCTCCYVNSTSNKGSSHHARVNAKPIRHRVCCVSGKLTVDATG